jgi:hypothetical protein
MTLILMTGVIAKKWVFGRENSNLNIQKSQKVTPNLNVRTEIANFFTEHTSTIDQCYGEKKKECNSHAERRHATVHHGDHVPGHHAHPVTSFNRHLLL